MLLYLFPYLLAYVAASFSEDLWRDIQQVIQECQSISDNVTINVILDESSMPLVHFIDRSDNDTEFEMVTDCFDEKYDGSYMYKASSWNGENDEQMADIIDTGVSIEENDAFLDKYGFSDLTQKYDSSQ